MQAESLSHEVLQLDELQQKLTKGVAGVGVLSALGYSVTGGKLLLVGVVQTIVTVASSILTHYAVKFQLVGSHYSFVAVHTVASLLTGVVTSLFYLTLIAAPLHPYSVIMCTLLFSAPSIIAGLCLFGITVYRESKKTTPPLPDTGPSIRTKPRPAPPDCVGTPGKAQTKIYIHLKASGRQAIPCSLEGFSKLLSHKSEMHREEFARHDQRLRAQIERIMMQTGSPNYKKVLRLFTFFARENNLDAGKYETIMKLIEEWDKGDRKQLKGKILGQIGRITRSDQRKGADPNQDFFKTMNEALQEGVNERS